MRGDIADDGGAGTDDGLIADGDCGDDGGAGADESAITEGDVAGESGAGADVDAVAELAFVVDGGTGIDDAELADAGMGADDRGGEDHGAFPELGGGRDDSGRVDEDGEAQAEGTRKFCQSSAVEVVSDGDDRAVNGVDADERREAVDGAEDGDTVDHGALEGGVVVDDAADGGDAGPIHEFKKHASLATGSEDNNRHRAPESEGTEVGEDINPVANVGVTHYRQECKEKNCEIRRRRERVGIRGGTGGVVGG